MPRDVKPRSYHSRLREERAAGTRRRILVATAALLEQKGYAATTVATIARRAGVSVDTVYTSVGRKPELVLAVVDDILGGADGPVPVEQRDYVVAMRAAAGAAEKLETYAAAVARLLPRLAPLVVALTRAAEEDPACRKARRRLDERRAQNMLLLAADLRATGELRDDLDDATVADLIWSTNAVEYFLLLQGRGWTPERYGTVLADVWSRTLLAR